MVNTKKIKSLLIEKDFSRAEISNILGISTNSFSRKINNKSQFTLNEVFLLKKALDIKDIEKVFFIENIPNTQQI